MKKQCSAVVFSLAVLLMPPRSAFPWGKEGHGIINSNAAALMPAPLDSFFRFYSESLSVLGGEPDDWCKVKPELKNWHFIDLDLLEAYPFQGVPRTYEKARAKYGMKLNEAGILPWAIERSYNDLVRDFRKASWPAVRNDLVALAHYIGDGHQPQHTVLNYNGRRTGNPGVHFRFEIELIERFRPRFDSLPNHALIRPKGKFDSLNQHTFSFIIHSFTMADSVNTADISCKSARPEYDSLYYECYRNRMVPLIRNQLGAAASTVAAYWYSAWIEAGRPALKWK